MNYEFSCTELAAMSDNIAKLNQDINKLDGHRRNMMEELKVLRDITLFYHERQRELRGAGPPKRPAEDNTQGSTRQHGTTEAPDEPGPTTGDNAGGSDTDTRETKEQL